jgi:hypothetical protein
MISSIRVNTWSGIVISFDILHDLNATTIDFAENHSVSSNDDVYMELSN